jgi:hypothetical protein
MEFLSSVWASTNYEPIWSLLPAHRVKRERKYSTYVARHDTLVAFQFVVVYYWTDPIRYYWPMVVPAAVGRRWRRSRMWSISAVFDHVLSDVSLFVPLRWSSARGSGRTATSWSLAWRHSDAKEIKQASVGALGKGKNTGTKRIQRRPSMSSESSKDCWGGAELRRQNWAAAWPVRCRNLGGKGERRRCIYRAARFGSWSSGACGAIQR